MLIPDDRRHLTSRTFVLRLEAHEYPVNVEI